MLPLLNVAGGQTGGLRLSLVSFLLSVLCRPQRPSEGGYLSAFYYPF